MPVQLDKLIQFTHAELRNNLKFITPKWSAATLDEILRVFKHSKFAEFTNLWDTAVTSDKMEKYQELRALIRREADTSEYILEMLADWYVSQFVKVAGTETPL